MISFNIIMCIDKYVKYVGEFDTTEGAIQSIKK